MLKNLLKLWSFEPAFKETVHIASLKIYLEGASASHPVYGQVVGSSASVEDRMQLANEELNERICTVINLNEYKDKTYNIRSPLDGGVTSTIDFSSVFPDNSTDNYKPAKSNGIAIHQDWERACLNACYELVERHVVLMSWLGHIKPEKVEIFDSSPIHKLSEHYESAAYSFGYQMVAPYHKPIYVYMMRLRPLQITSPFIMGFGAAMTQEEALAKAERECLQRLGFLWGEEIPLESPTITPSPDLHQEFYLCPKNHPIIEAWLSGEFYTEYFRNPSCLTMEFVDITTEECGTLKVAKAICKDALQLYFGLYEEGLFKALSGTNRSIHPIA